MDLRDNDTLKDILIREVGINKKVDLILNNGASYSGTIIKIATHYIVLKLSGNRSFFDAPPSTLKLSSFTPLSVSIAVKTSID